jgi:L-rhamnose mutarotase
MLLLVDVPEKVLYSIFEVDQSEKVALLDLSPEVKRWYETSVMVYQ